MIDKYQEAIHGCINAMKSGEFSSMKEFNTIYGTSSNFFLAMTRLKWIKCVKRGKNPKYEVYLDAEKVEPHHARTLLDTIDEMVEEKKKGPGPSKQMQNLLDSVLIEELKRRGYSGSLVKRSTVQI